MKNLFLSFLLMAFSLSLSAKESAFLERAKAEFQKKVKEETPPLWAVSQIQNDLAPFKEKGISQSLLKQLLLEEEDRGLVYYRIRGGKLSVLACNPSCADSSLNFRFQAMKQKLEILCESVKMPDLDFVICLHDSADDFKGINVPVFVFAKRKDTDFAIAIPDFEVLGNQEKLFKQIKKGVLKNPWNKKIPKAYWRGATTGGIFTPSNFLDFPRSQAVKASIDHPTLIDARFTDLVQCEEKEKVQRVFSSYFSERTSVEEHFPYKYQLLLDGNSCAYLRAYWQFFSNCAVFKHDSENIQWYYGALRPYVHYIPLENKLGDLIEKIEWAKLHDTEVQKIIENAQEFADKNLRHSDLFYYLYLVFSEYAKLQKM